MKPISVSDREKLLLEFFEIFAKINVVICEKRTKGEISKECFLFYTDEVLLPVTEKVKSLLE